ncbi:MAG: hypothetical protein ETSY2_10830 [Candidatus Entotheonella gemina]|uniref:Uncharacterized protein n=1 Tax=Candidatus Entotheonella gemina TaxID=1429439 RepID=W4MBE3_9BACT|nr:MAG: hypothetical protein ETSY2_10830 [Candidatus Entotheonella gemina]
MPTLEIDISKQMLDHLHMELGEFADTMKAMTALKMYELGRLSSHEAATLAGASRGEFLQLLHTHQIHPFEQVDDNGAPTRPVFELPDATVLRLAAMQMPAWQTRRLQELLAQQREGPLSMEEKSELTELLALHDLGLLLKSEAIAEAVRRGIREAGSEA